MKAWKKVLCIVLIALVVTTAMLLFTPEEKDCCLCNSFRYHAPCLIDLETGKMIELDLYFPHETKVAELANPQPKMETFMFVHLGNITGTKLTDSNSLSNNSPLISTRK